MTNSSDNGFFDYYNTLNDCHLGARGEGGRPGGDVGGVGQEGRRGLVTFDEMFGQRQWGLDTVWKWVVFRIWNEQALVSFWVKLVILT